MPKFQPYTSVFVHLFSGRFKLKKQCFLLNFVPVAVTEWNILWQTLTKRQSAVSQETKPQSTGLKTCLKTESHRGGRQRSCDAFIYHHVQFVERLYFKTKVFSKVLIQSSRQKLCNISHIRKVKLITAIKVNCDDILEQL